VLRRLPLDDVVRGDYILGSGPRHVRLLGPGGRALHLPLRDADLAGAVAQALVRAQTVHGRSQPRGTARLLEMRVHAGAPRTASRPQEWATLLVWMPAIGLAVVTNALGPWW